MSLRDCDVNRSLGNATAAVGWKPQPSRDTNRHLLDRDAWPPFLPTSVEEVAAAVDAFVELFIRRTIEFRCGQSRDGGFADVFLVRWLNTAFDRQRALGRLVAACEEQQTEGPVWLLERARHRMDCAVRDAERELARHRPGEAGRTITFARPLAYRVARRSHDRLSLCTLPDTDEGEAAASHAAAESDRERQRLECVALEEDVGPAEEHDSGRASGVIHHGVFSTCRTGRAAPVEVSRTAPRVSRRGEEVEEEEGSDDGDQPLVVDPAGVFDGFTERHLRRSARRMLWALLTYWAVPMTLVALSAVYVRSGSQPPA